jgi:ABC-type phosphate/phosphonate transport system substrate-binding protein
MIAALPMYERPQTVAAHDRLWGLMRDSLRDHGIAAPDGLDRDTPYDVGWGRADLVVGQICNLPLRARHWGRVTLIAAMDYDVPGSGPGLYHSVFVVRADDRATALTDCAGYRFVYSDPLSNSGWGAPWQSAQAQGVALNPVVCSGGHLESIRAVADGRADMAGIDVISFRNFQRWEPVAAQVRIIGRTHDSPGMTLITGTGRDVAPCRAALTQAVAALGAGDRDLLWLRALIPLPDSAYSLPFPPDPAALGA